MAIACSSIQSSSMARMTREYYDVFVSFNGDTRFNFTDLLFGALERNRIVAFRDDTMVRKGEDIAHELLQAIERSKVFIVVFSKDYASSTWCLLELRKILDCCQESRRRVLPIFYDVSPSVVRKQSGGYRKAFVKHGRRFRGDLEKMEEVKRWREALIQVAGMGGWDIGNKPQDAQIQEIVKEIMSILSHEISRLPNDLVGMQSPLEELGKLYPVRLVNDAQILGIFGKSGTGKTTLATVLYDRISHQFDACCLIDNVSKIYQHSGPKGVQKQLLGQTLKEENLQIYNLYNAANLIRSRLRRVRALVVLDNVDQVQQLEKLVINREWLDAGSRIIIISRDEHILKEYGVDVVFKVPLLNWDNSIQLFCRKAFKSDDIMKEYKKLTYGILEYAKGLPLAIKVLGSFLFDRDVSEWRSALARLRENPSKDIMNVLRLSFDGLEKLEKEIFLDIACFFNWYPEPYVKKVLNCCEFHADIGIRVLIDKSLISIRYDSYRLDNTIKMHGLLQELGRKIVQQKPRKWSRLWLHKYFYNVMLENVEENVEAMVLTRTSLQETEMLMAETLSKMSHLRLLILDEVNFSGNLNCLSNELRYVEWCEYPFMHLPSNFQPNQLVELILKYSSVKQLWEGKEYLPSLRILDLRHSKNLIKMPDFTEVPNLERLNLEGCIKLVQVNPSIGLLRKLILLNLKGCKSLVSIPNNLLGLSSLKYLNISGCSKVFNNLLRVENLKKLDIDETTLASRSTSSILKWITLPFHFLYPRALKDSGSPCCLLPNFSCLRELDISFCGLSQIPIAIGCISCLEILNLGGNNFVRLPSLKELSRLLYLNLQHCEQLQSLPDLPSPTNLPLRRQLEQDRMFINSGYWRLYRAGLYIFNCPKLGERERCSSTTFFWMTQVIQANKESCSPFDEIDMVIPGSEIPRWFHNQSVGNSISIDPSPIMHDNNCIGIAYCAVFVVHNDPTTLRNESKPFVAIGFQHKVDWIYADIQVLLDIDLITVESDHIWLFYFTQKKYFYMMDQIKHKMHDPDGIKLTTFTNEGQGLHLEVKNCGYRWVFKQDLEPSNLTMMYNGNLLTRKRKFLAIEDKSQP